MNRRSIPTCLLMACVLAGCTDRGTDKPLTQVSPPVASVSAAPVDSPSPSPSASPSPSSSPSASPSAAASRISVTTRDVAGVRIGTDARAAEKALRAALGAPRTEPIPECTREKGRLLNWDTLQVILSDGAEGGAVTLYGWSVEDGRSRFTYALPYDIALGTPTRQAVRRIPGGTGMVAEEGPYTGTYIVTTPRAVDVLWLSGDKPNDRGVIDYVAYRSATCD